MKRSLHLFRPCRRDDQQLRAVTTQVCREFGELDVVANLQPDTMSLKFDEPWLLPRLENHSLSVPQVDFSIDRCPVGGRGKGGVVKESIRAFCESADDETPGRPGDLLERRERIARISVRLGFESILVHVPAT